MAEEKIDYKALIKQEYARCASDPIYFMKKYVYIQTTKGRCLFALFLFQEKLLRIFQKNDRVLILKSRQLGITTLCAGYALWMMIFKKDQSILCLAPDRDKAKAIITKIRFAYDQLPGWMKSGCKNIEHNKTTLKLENGSVAEAVSGASKSARSKTANFLVLDEAAFIDNAEDLWGSAQQTLSTGGSAVVLSTPNGAAGWFYDMWCDAEQEKNNFVAVPLPWNMHPDRDRAWREAQDKELGKRMAAQECDCDFLTSGNTYLDSDDIDFFHDLVEDPVEMTGANKDWWIWKYPHEVKQCMVVVDTAKGNGNDNSAVEVIEIFSGDQVAEYQGQMDPKNLAQFAVYTAKQYNNALLIIENTGIGEATVSHAKDENYPNFYYHPKGDIDGIDQYMDKYNFSDPSKMMAGFPTSTKTRPLIIYDFKQYIIERSIRLRSRRLHVEMKTFIWKDNKAQARPGAHDDLFMTYAIGMHLRNTAIEYQSVSIEMKKMMLDNIRKNSSFDYGLIKKPANNPYEMKIKGEIQDISWVIGASKDTEW